MMVNVPVELIDEACLHCPELDIDIFTKEVDGHMVGNDGEVKAVHEVTNRCKCSSYDKCNRMFDILQEATKKQSVAKPKTTTKAKSTRTTKAKTK